MEDDIADPHYCKNTHNDYVDLMTINLQIILMQNS